MYYDVPGIEDTPGFDLLSPEEQQAFKDSKRKAKNRKIREDAENLPMTLALIEGTLRSTKGNLGRSARQLGTTRPVLRRKIMSTPSLRAVMDDIRDEIIDDTETVLFEQAEMGNMTAVSLILKTLGKDRGYSEKNTVEHEIGASITNSAQLIEQMRKGGKEVAQIEENFIEVE